MLGVPFSLLALDCSRSVACSSSKSVSKAIQSLQKTMLAQDVWRCASVTDCMALLLHILSVLHFRIQTASGLHITEVAGQHAACVVLELSPHESHSHIQQQSTPWTGGTQTYHRLI
jgi:hypothetical protein